MHSRSSVRDRVAPVATGVLLATAACVFAWRGEADIVGDHDLRGVQTVRIDLPSTPMAIETCEPSAPGACPESLRYAGRVLATGGSAADARRHARTPALVFERRGTLARLGVDIPLSIRGLVDLELGALALPADRDLDVHTDLGDVEVYGSRGAVMIAVGRGDVLVEGGDGGVAVDVDVGDIEVHGGGDVDLATSTGKVDVLQSTAGRHVFIDADGDVTVELAASTDLDLDVAAGGPISVRTSTVVALADGRLKRRTGSGSAQIVIRCGGALTITERAGQ